MTKIEDEVVVFRLACLVEDVTRSERAALHRRAKHIERRWNAATVTNARHLAKHGTIDLEAEIP